jgi:regulator of protease activity HflC (stomatin/prohibitin superfamily)
VRRFDWLAFTLGFFTCFILMGAVLMLGSGVATFSARADAERMRRLEEMARHEAEAARRHAEAAVAAEAAARAEAEAAVQATRPTATRPKP